MDVSDAGQRRPGAASPEPLGWVGVTNDFVLRVLLSVCSGCTYTGGVSFNCVLGMFIRNLCREKNTGWGCVLTGCKLGVWQRVR